MSSVEDREREREEAMRAALEGTRRLARPEDYVFDKSQEMFWDLRDGTLHTEKAVDASIPLELWRVVVEEGGQGARGRPARPRERLVKPSSDILRVENDQFVEGTTWWPGMPQIIKDWFIDSDGFQPSIGRRIYNQYRCPPSLAGDPDKAGRWIDHVKKLWPDPKEHEYFFDYCAHMLQRPQEKCNAAIVLSGTQGIGKDAALNPIKSAVGNWNVKGIDPDELFAAFRPWLQTLMLVIDEVRPSKDEFHATAMYNILKAMSAAPPDTLPLNEKYRKLRYVINVMRVFVTTNNWMSMFIPPDDRRLFIMHSNLAQRWHEEEGKPNYFVELFAWCAAEGNRHVQAWLMARDLSRFNPKAQIERTEGWRSIAGSWSEPEDMIAALIDKKGRPDVIMGTDILEFPFDDRDEVLSLMKSPRRIAHRMLSAGYLMVQCQSSSRWSWTEKGQKKRTRFAFVLQENLAGRATVEAVKEELAARA